MLKGYLPPETAHPDNNPYGDMIDAQLTTEIFGLLAPGVPNVALEIAHLPVRTAGYGDAVLISEFYIVMHSLAALEPRGNLAPERLENLAMPLGSTYQITWFQLDVGFRQASAWGRIHLGGNSRCSLPAIPG